VVGGSFGRYLRVDLATAAAQALPLDARDLRAVIGGVGLGALLLLRETSPGYDPLGPEAALVFAFGPLVGTPLTTSAKLAVVAKSPLTQRISDALSSSDFALAGKRTGHDAIVIVERAPLPSLLLIDDDRVEVLPCDDLWGRGLSTTEVNRRLTERYPGFVFAVIGVAGERLVRYAGLSNDGRHAGRGGLGAVLGSKRLKAVGVRGTRRTPLADPPRVVALSKDLAKRSLGAATEKYREIGTVANLATLNRLAALPTRNFQASTFESAADLSGEELKLTRERGRGSCANCTIGCEHFFEVKPGAPARKAEYENVFALGPLCGVRDPALVLAASAACDELGLDTISAGGTIAFAMECAERGLLDAGPWAEDARGLRFGDGERLLATLDAIAHRRGPLGDLLAEGSRLAAERVGPPAPDFAPHVKGLEIPGYEPRALQTMALGFAVGSRGADHNKSGAYEVDLSGKTDRLAPSLDAARLAVETEDKAALMDALILCKFLRGVFADLFAESAVLLAAVTGVDFTARELREAARRIVLLKKLFNVAQGWTEAEDTLPARFFDEGLPGGVAEGARLSRARLGAMRRAYYEARGWRPDGTIPDEMVNAADLGLSCALEPSRQAAGVTPPGRDAASAERA
jgi:aldehyde:ferredoxin oxidoreductase